MKKLILSALLLAPTVMFGRTTEATHKVSSPDKKYELTFYHDKLDDARKELCYSVDFNGETIIEKSKFGVLIENQLFESALAVPNEDVEFWCENLELTGVEYTSVDNTWKQIYGERAEVRDNYNQMELSFLKGEHTSQNEYNKLKSYFMNIEVRAYNEGIAFRYHFPEALNGLFLHIVGEQTSFTLPKGTMAYYEKWAQGPYEVRPLEGWGDDESERPLTLRLPSGKLVTLTEAKMINYVRGKFKLSKEQESTLEVSMYDCADIITPYDTPWRVVMAAENDVELLNNNDIILNLNDPCQIEDTSWIKPGKVFRTGLTQKAVMEGIDFAAARGYQYVHLDAGWYGLERAIASDARKEDPKKDLNMKALCEYAKSKGLGIFLYVNMRALVNQLDEMLPIYNEWGVSGIKFGFVQIGNQGWSTWLHDAVKKCAKHKILVDIHDEYRPTGFSRTYPNLLSQEGIRGNEEWPDATHNTILPFTRYIAGAGDYTYAYYDPRLKNTHAHQLTMPIICYSPVQFMHWYDTPNEYGNEPEMALWSAIPTVWDYSEAIDGKIGEYIVQTRRSGDEWYIGAITNNDARTVSIDLTNILESGKKYTAYIYEDDMSLGTKSNVKSSEKKIKSTQTLKFDLLPRGAVAIHLVPITK
ncbi:MAG: glycoside hydrolase family 97 N-terminal domain-containing protein [Rikenellaceae bacterium]